jgi:hypothetical protein
MTVFSDIYKSFLLVGLEKSITNSAFKPEKSIWCKINKNFNFIGNKESTIN